MTVRSGVRGALSRFAHLARAASPATAKADEDEDKKKKDDDTSAEGDEEDDDEDKKKKDDEAAEGDDEEKGGDDEDKKDKKDDEEASASTMTSAEIRAHGRGRRAERDRCAAIFASEHAAGNLPLAAHLAFETGASTKEAIGTLKASSAGGSRGGGLHARMGAEGAPRVGADRSAPSRDTPDGAAAFVLRAAGLGPKRGS